MFKTLCASLLKSSKKTSNFANTAQAEQEAYSNLIMQQSILLDEYEDLIKAYDEQINKDTNSCSAVSHPDNSSCDSCPTDNSSRLHD